MGDSLNLRCLKNLITDGIPVRIIGENGEPVSVPDSDGTKFAVFVGNKKCHYLSYEDFKDLIKFMDIRAKKEVESICGKLSIQSMS